MSEETDIKEKIYFEASTVETIDRSLYDYISNLKLSVGTNEGAKIVPVLWGTSERSFLAKNNKEARDKQGTLKFPIISIKRTSLSKPQASPGVFIGNVFEEPDNKGGSLEVSRVIHQEKTSVFSAADNKRLTGQENYPRENKKIVYRTVSAPMPVNVSLTYEINIRTEYQQHMNELILPFITIPGTVNYIPLKYRSHIYEAFIQGDFQSGDNLADYSSDERKFETKITVKVVGYLVGQGNNREKPHFSIRENFVEIKIPKERTMIDPEELKKYGL
tara:strand:+ start:4370 stop:5194 length:825 start_codon:yes stop_codon:yes gene_type:complete